MKPDVEHISDKSEICESANSVNLGCNIFFWLFRRSLTEEFSNADDYHIAFWISLALMVISSLSFMVSSVTRFGDFLHFGQLFKGFGNN